MQQGLATTNLNQVINNIPRVFSHNPISINFINLSDETITYACLDEYGNEYKHGSLRPSETKSQKTYATHPWSLHRKSGRICIYNPSEMIEPCSTVQLTILWNFEVSIVDKLQRN